MDPGWDGCDIGGDVQIPTEWAEEISGAIAEAAQSPIQAEESGLGAACDPGWDVQHGWDPSTSAEDSASPPVNHALSEEEAAALLVDVLGKSAVNTEDGMLQVEPDPAEVEQWSEEKRRDVQDVLGQVTAQPENVQLIADALQIEAARLEDLMAEHEEALAQAGYDQEAPDVIALAQQIQELHTKIQDLTEQYISLAGLPAPGMRGPDFRM